MFSFALEFRRHCCCALFEQMKVVSTVGGDKSGTDQQQTNAKIRHHVLLTAVIHTNTAVSYHSTRSYVLMHASMCTRDIMQLLKGSTLDSKIPAQAGGGNGVWGATKNVSKFECVRPKYENFSGIKGGLSKQKTNKSSLVPVAVLWRSHRC